MNRKAANPGPTIAQTSIEEAVRRAIADDCAVDGGLFELDALENLEECALDFAGCVFRRVRFAAIDARRVHFSNCRFEQCDFSGLPFKDGTLTRVEFIGCRGAGCTFEHMKMKDVLFDQCQLNYLTLAACHMERVEFIDCDLSHSMLFESAQKEFVLARCRLVASEIQATPLKGVDLSECDLQQISIQPELLRGATIQLAQTPMILGIFGVQVKL